MSPLTMGVSGSSAPQAAERAPLRATVIALRSICQLALTQGHWRGAAAAVILGRGATNGRTQR